MPTPASASARADRPRALLLGLLLAAAALAAVAVFAGRSTPAHAATRAANTNVIFGVAEDAGKYAEDKGVRVARDLNDVGMGAQRWTLLFDPANPTAIVEQAFIDRALPTAVANGQQIILSLFQKGAAAPDPTAFCGWAASVASRYKAIRKFIIGNEVNATRFWSPQHTGDDPNAGPRSYYNVLAACYDALKKVSPDIEVIGMGLAPRSVDSNSTKPLDFIRAVGTVYRASGRGTAIMDALAVHPYPNPNASPPPAPAAAGYQDKGFYGIPQLDRVKQAAYDAFTGTAQPTPVNGLKLVVDEVGYQTDTTGIAGYNGTETSPVVSDADQATYHAAIVSLYACDPLVESVLFFHLIDEAQRNPDATSGGWQSGIEWPDGAPKPSYAAVKQAIAAGCTTAPMAWTPASTATATTIATTPATTTAATTTAPSDAGSGQAQLAQLEEALPSAAVDGPVFTLITLPPDVKQALIDRSVPRFIVGPDGAGIWEFDPGEAFWQTDVKTQQDILLQTWTFAAPGGATATGSLSGVRTSASLIGFILRLVVQTEVASGTNVSKLCHELGVAGFVVCKGRGVSGRSAAGIKLFASGSVKLSKGASLRVKMKRSSKVTPGVYFTIVRLQAATDPTKVGLIISRPYNVTATKLAADRAKKKPVAPAKKKK